MFRKNIIVFILVFLMTVLLPVRGSGGDEPLKDYELAQRAFSAANARLENLEIAFWGSLTQKMTFSEMKPFLLKLLQSQGMGDKQFWEENPDTAGLKVTVTAQKMTLIMALENTDETDQGTYFLIKITAENFSETSPQILDELANDLKRQLIAEKGNEENRKFVQFTGSYAGKLTNTVEKELIEQILKAVKARKVAGISDGQLLSISACSPLANAIQDIYRRDINIQAALRYHDYDGRTYLSVGVPLLDGEF